MMHNAQLEIQPFMRYQSIQHESLFSTFNISFPNKLKKVLKMNNACKLKKGHMDTSY